MADEFFEYQKIIKKALEENPSEKNWQEELVWFNRKLANLQHERLIHLMVTLTVGIAALISCFTILISPILPLLLLSIILVTPFIAYIFHYRKLENTTQYWYVLLDKIRKKISQNIKSH